MSNCDPVLGKEKDIKAEVADLASDLICNSEQDSSEFIGYLSAASLLKLLCVMNNIARKIYPLGDIVPPEEFLNTNSSYWVGGVPLDFALCDLAFYRYSLEEIGGSGSGGCGGLKFNLRINTPQGEDILIFSDWVELTEMCGSVITDGLAEFSDDFKNISKLIIPKCSRIDVFIGDCSFGQGLRIDLLGHLPLSC